MQACRVRTKNVARWRPRYCAASTRHMQLDVNRWIQLAFDQRKTVSGGPHTGRSTKESLHATPHSLEEAYADLHFLQRHSTVAQSGYVG
jgi:hypothetical protein